MPHFRGIPVVPTRDNCILVPSSCRKLKKWTHVLKNTKKVPSSCPKLFFGTLPPSIFLIIPKLPLYFFFFSLFLLSSFFFPPHLLRSQPPRTKDSELPQQIFLSPHRFFPAELPNPEDRIPIPFSLTLT